MKKSFFTDSVSTILRLVVVLSYTVFRVSREGLYFQFARILLTIDSVVRKRRLSIPCCKIFTPFSGGCPNSKGVSCRTFNMDSDKSEDIETHDLHCGLDDTNRLSPSQFYQPLRTLTRHMTKQFTSEDLTSKKFCQTGDNCDEVKYLTEMMLLLLSKPEDVPIHDNLENLPSTFHGQEMVADIGQPNSPGNN